MNTRAVLCRPLVRLGLTIAVTCFSGIGMASWASPEGNDPDFAASFSRAYSFLDTMMDAYAQGPAVRLSQSYSDQQGLQSTGFVYDNSLVLMAHLLRGRSDDISRATLLGDAFLHAQQVDSMADGRVRQAYFVDQPDGAGVFLRPALFPFFFLGSATGDMAWTGMALAQLSRRTGDPRYLNGAVRLGHWIVDNTFDTRGAGGFNFGVDNGNNKLLFKSTEHNIDCIAFFTLLRQLTGDASWSSQADHARTFVDAMFDPVRGLFFTGTTGDGATISPDNLPEDVQTWSFLATFDKSHARSLEWVKTNLATTDTPQTIHSSLTDNQRIVGVSFASQSLRALAPSDPFSPPPDPNAVWLEGTGHLATALLARGLRAHRDLPGFHGDMDTARTLLEDILVAQQTLGQGQTVGGNAIANGQGVLAASSVLNTGFGFSFSPHLHIAATSWFVIAGQRGNPFQLGLHADRDQDDDD
jgi:hypothetical protein